MMDKVRKLRLTTPQTLVLGLLASILIGAILLKLPISNNKNIDFLDCLFTATSAVCVTGLNTVVPAEQFSTVGKVILMILIEIGGIGFMSFIALLLMIMRKKINLSERILIKESLNQNDNKGIVSLIRKVFVYIAIIELVGAVALSIKFIPEYGIKTGIFYAIFHSISAVCNAGFDILGNSSFIKYQYNSFISVTIMILIILGGLGYTVWIDIIAAIKKKIIKKKDTKKIIKEISTNSKIVIITTLILFISGTILTLFFEKDNINTMQSDNLCQKILKSSFYSVTLRTAGFETMKSANLTTATKFLSLIYMLIGGSSGSTAGGIKITTFSLIILMVISYIKGEENTVIFKRKIPNRSLKRAIVIFFSSLFIIIVSIMALSITEDTRPDESSYITYVEEQNINFLDIFYEVFSAFGTVGLTLGLTSRLTVYGKFIIMVLMIIGRAGPITISYAILKRSNKKSEIKYPEGDFLVG